MKYWHKNEQAAPPKSISNNLVTLYKDFCRKNKGDNFDFYKYFKQKKLHTPKSLTLQLEIVHSLHQFLFDKIDILNSPDWLYKLHALQYYSYGSYVTSFENDDVTKFHHENAYLVYSLNLYAWAKLC